MQRLTGLVYERHVSSSNFYQLSIRVYIYERHVSSGRAICVRVRALERERRRLRVEFECECSSASARVLERRLSTRLSNSRVQSLALDAEYKFHVTCTVHVHDGHVHDGHVQMVCVDHAYILLSPQKIFKPLSIVGKNQLQKLRRLRSR